MLDRLSTLPDEVLCHILSFLPTKLSVATSVLARRWRFLWTRVPILDLCIENSHNGLSGFQIIFRILMLHEAQKRNSFRLTYLPHGDYGLDYDFETCVLMATNWNIPNIDLCLNHQLRLPRRLFTYKSLVELKLDLCDIVTPVISLPCLKRLECCSVRFHDDETITMICSGCPMLEFFSMEGCMYDGLTFCHISSSSIKTLWLRFSSSGFDDDKDFPVQISAPALRNLALGVGLSWRMTIQILTSLDGADVFLECYTVDQPEVRPVVNFIESFREAKSLKLSIDDKLIPGVGDDPLNLHFDMLTKLEWECDWIFLMRFLSCANNLQDLILGDVEDTKRCFIEPKDVPRCLVTHLKKVTFSRFYYAEADFEIVRYVLKNSHVLKNMRIRLARWDSHADISNIQTFYRKSATCVVDFC